MAGVVAMAAVIEDFETKPRKKPRKDDDSPGAKTITNYFSPVPKVAEKHFSPPRSSNIRDYFSRKPPSLSKEKPAPPLDRPKETCPNPHATPPPGKPSQRRKSKAARKPHVKEAVTGSPDLGGEVTAISVSYAPTSLVVSDTGAAPAKPCGEGLGEDKLSGAGDTGTLTAAVPTLKGSSRGLKSGKRPKVRQLQPDAPDASVKPRKKKSKAEKRLPLPLGPPEATGAEQVPCDAGVEVNVDEDSSLPRSTVMVSFEDFLQSQSQGEGANERKALGEGEATPHVAAEKMETTGDRLGVPLTEEDAAAPPLLPGPLKISPRTLTVHAEVHAVTAREPARPCKRLASIFTVKRKADGGVGASHPAHAEPSTPPPPPPPNTLPPHRRSNVVLQEEDLELAVVESSSAPKCSQVERRQFLAAFKRPGSNQAAARSQAKQEQEKEQEEAKHPHREEEVEGKEGTGSAQPSDAPTSTQSNEKKAAMGKKKSRRKMELPPSKLEAAVEANDAAASGAANTLEVQKRRSRREAPNGEALQPEGASSTTAQVPASRRPKRERSADRPPPPESPLQTSTPRARRRSRRGVYEAHLVSPTDTRGSPIRMRFTRIQRNATKVGTDVEQDSGPIASKTAGAAKQKSRAKRLVEEAKVRRRRKVAEEERPSGRSSSRTQTTPGCANAEEEDSLICMEDSQGKPRLREKTPKRKSKPRLRSLNDVLGKASAPASKVAPLFQDRRSGKPCVTGTGPDQGPENRLDQETCLARRQFLSSGLPDSFKKLVVKTAATREALSLALSCASFQPAVHILQAPEGSPLWSLPWPAAPALRSLREDWGLPSGAAQTPGGPGPLQPSTAPAPRALPDPGAADQRPSLPDPLRQHLLEEILSSHPSFPAQRFLNCFLRRRDLHLQQTATTTTADPLGGTRKRKAEGDASGKLAKKKRSSLRAEEDERRATATATATATPSLEPSPPRRGRRRRQKEKEEQQCPEASESACTPAPKDSVIVLEDSPPGGGAVIDALEDVTREELLWTEKYQPQHSGDLIGNTSALRKLHCWLKEWKLRADREERTRQKESRREEGGHDPDWDCGGESGSQDPEDLLCNTLLISGPSGVGKTAAVYACALELGFKVFEVNASAQRSGRLILSQLKEATQSHQVDIHGPNAHKPSYFSAGTGAARSGPSPRKVNSPRRVVSSPGKPPPSPRGPRRGALAPSALANFFKLGRPAGTTEPSWPTAAPKKISTKARAPTTTPIVTGDGGGAKDSPAGGPEASKKTATSLILFEEVDVIFDEDAGFLGAIKTFMTTTKRPVILTTSDPHFSSLFDGYLEEVHFTAPSMDTASSYLRLLCLTEDTPTSARDVSTLLRLNRGDIRQSLLQLQFWSCSSRGRCRGATPPDPPPEAMAAAMVVRSQPPAWCGAPPDPPRWEGGCAESMLGLPNLRPHLHQLLEEPDACWEMLADSRRRGVDLLYSNMHILLPLPLTQLPVPPLPQLTVDLSTPPSPFPSARPQPEADLVGVAAAGVDVAPAGVDVAPAGVGVALVGMDVAPAGVDVALMGMDLAPAGVGVAPAGVDVAPAGVDVAPAGVGVAPAGVGVAPAGVSEALEDGSPLKLSKRMRKHKRLAAKDPLHSGSDSEDDFLSLGPRQGPPLPAPQLGGAVPESFPSPPPRQRREPPTPQQRAVSGPVSAGLNALANFLDDLSHMDACSTRGQGAATGGQGRVRDGMVDEAPLEGPGASRAEAERAVEIQAAVEALSFRRCLATVTEAQRGAKALGGGGEVEQAALELSLPVAAHQRAFSLTPASPCWPQLLRRCRETTGALQASGAFVTLGSRPELFLDYLPALRAVCRAEQLKEQGKVKRRFLHYLDSIHLGLSRDTLQDLASPFP